MTPTTVGASPVLTGGTGGNWDRLGVHTPAGAPRFGLQLVFSGLPAGSGFYPG